MHQSLMTLWPSLMSLVDRGQTHNWLWLSSSPSALRGSTVTSRMPARLQDVAKVNGKNTQNYKRLLSNTYNWKWMDRTLVSWQPEHNGK